MLSYSKSNGTKIKRTGRKHIKVNSVTEMKIRELHKTTPNLADIDGIMKLFSLPRKEVERILNA